MTRHCLAFAMNLGGSAQHTLAIGISIDATTATATARQLRAIAVPAVFRRSLQTRTRRGIWLQKSTPSGSSIDRVFISSMYGSRVAQEGMSRIDVNPLAQVSCREMLTPASAPSRITSAQSYPTVNWRLRGYEAKFLGPRATFTRATPAGTSVLHVV